MSKKPTKEQIEFATKAFINDVKKSYAEENLSPHMAVYAVLHRIDQYLKQRARFLKEPSFDLDWIVTLVEQEAEKKQKTIGKNWLIGLLIEWLQKCGCPKNQAQDAVSAWLDISKTQAKNTQRLLHKKSEMPFFRIEDMSRPDFEQLLLQELANFIKDIKKPFPTSYRKAAAAYQAFKTEIFKEKD